jgi:imidazole glycerol-phosphate synthase subunit HisH
MTLALIDYGSGNLRSVARALAAAGAGDVVVTDDASVVAAADRIVLPGVGAFADCARGLSGLPGMIEALNQRVLTDGVPFLGICVGMQLLADRGLEFETANGLGWIAGETTALAPTDPVARIPHMGWNRVTPEPHPVLDAAWDGQPQEVYFVHSYAFRARDPKSVIGIADHGGERFAAIIARDNILGVQFHPEKSQAAGLRLLAAWVKA